MMRLPSRPFAIRCAVMGVVVSLPLLAAQYSSVSPRELQRRLERDTDQLVNSLRSQRNPVSRSNAPSGPSPWELELRGRREREARARADQARMDAEWRRDHPNETRQQYFARIDRENAAKARLERQQREDARRAQLARAAAERERQETADWARVRAAAGGYAANLRPPQFTTPLRAVEWYLAHARDARNEWAANQAAMLLIEGVGVSRDIAQAITLLHPQKTTAQISGKPHAETRALYSYLRLAFPDDCKSAGLETNAALARTELEAAAGQSDLAKWYLARVLQLSASSEDQKRALALITPGAIWTRTYFGAGIVAGPSGRDALFKHLGRVATFVVEQQRRFIPELLRELSPPEFEQFSDLLPFTQEPLRTESMSLYVDAVAVRVIPLTPGVAFNYYAYDQILERAGEAGIDGLFGLAALHRFHLLGMDDPGPFKPSWTHFRDRDRAVAALTRWAARDDVLGARARLAIEALAVEAGASQWWTPSKLNEVIDYQSAMAEYARWRDTTRPPTGSNLSIVQLRDQAEGRRHATRKAALEAFARRDATAPKLSDIPKFIVSFKSGDRWRDELQLLKSIHAADAADGGLFAVTHASFDLVQAAGQRVAAFSPTVYETVRRHLLFQAMRLGDAYAPLALIREVGWDLPPGATTKLTELNKARIARDQAAGRPEALLHKAILAAPNTDEAHRLLAEAAAAGSPLASRIILNRRVGEQMAREGGQPPSWKLDPQLIAEFDAAVAAGSNSPTDYAEWSLVQAVLDDALGSARNWFNYLHYWEADRQERLADAAFVTAVQPLTDALIATLSEWPGINQDDPLRREWAIAATSDRAAALKSLEANDGLAALKLFLNAAGRGDRGALELLAEHIRAGTGGLPRSPALADQFRAAAFKIAIADAEAGDTMAAGYIGECYRNGTRGVVASPEQALSWLRYAAELGHAGAARTLAQPDAQGLSRSQADLVHWAAVRDACEFREFLPRPPRRLGASRMDVTPIRPTLEAALTALQGLRAQKPMEPTPEQEDAEMLRSNAAKEELIKNPVNGLLLLAQIASGGNRYAAHQLAVILARGDYGVQPDPVFARRFHTAAMGLLERDAEYGDMSAAWRLGTYALGLSETPEIATALRWYTYAAELGYLAAAESLARLYTEGLPGLAPDEKQAARWTAYAEQIEGVAFKPRAPLK